MITQARLKELLHYDPSTGQFTWLVSSGRVRQGTRAGTVGGGGRVQIRVEGSQYRANRLAWRYMTGEEPDRDVDHRDGDPTNDRWDNLRLATRSQNLANAKVGERNSLGLKGVIERAGRFGAVIGINKTRIWLGTYDRPEQAASAYNLAAYLYFGEYAHAI